MPAKRLVEPLHQRRLGAEVRAERERFQLNAADAFLAGLEEQADVGFAEAINRLHRVADQKESAAVPGLPTRRQLLEQIVLGVGGVLKLVDQQVLNAIAER
jgi:hypothetical protein